MRQLLTLVTLIALTGCVSIPKQTVELSRTMQRHVSMAESAHLAVLDGYVEQRYERAEEFVFEHWTPKFIKTFLEKIDFDEAVCGLPSGFERSREVRDIVKAISKQVEKRRRSLLKEIRKAERELRAATQQHYRDMKRIGNALSSHIESTANRLDLEKRVRGWVMDPIDKVVPIKKMTTQLDKALND